MLQGKFDYVELVCQGESLEGYLVAVREGVGTLAGMKSNTAMLMSEVTDLKVISVGRTRFLKCVRCGKFKPADEVGQWASVVNPETGFATEQEDVCYVCLPTEESHQEHWQWFDQNDPMANY